MSQQHFSRPHFIPIRPQKQHTALTSLIDNSPGQGCGTHHYGTGTLVGFFPSNPTPCATPATFGIVIINPWVIYGRDPRSAVINIAFRPPPMFIIFLTQPRPSGGWRGWGDRRPRSPEFRSIKFRFGSRPLCNLAPVLLEAFKKSDYWIAIILGKERARKKIRGFIKKKVYLFPG